MNATENKKATTPAQDAAKKSFETASGSILITPVQIPKPAFIYRSQDDLKALIEFSKMSPRVRIDDKTAKVILTMGKFDLTENVLITLNDQGKIAMVTPLQTAEVLYHIVATK